MHGCCCCVSWNFVVAFCAFVLFGIFDCSLYINRQPYCCPCLSLYRKVSKSIPVEKKMNLCRTNHFLETTTTYKTQKVRTFARMNTFLMQGNDIASHNYVTFCWYTFQQHSRPRIEIQNYRWTVKGSDSLKWGVDHKRIYDVNGWDLSPGIVHRIHDNNYGESRKATMSCDPYRKIPFKSAPSPPLHRRYLFECVQYATRQFLSV